MYHFPSGPPPAPAGKKWKQVRGQPGNETDRYELVDDESSQKGVRKVTMPHPDITAEMLAELATERIRQKRGQLAVSAPVAPDQTEQPLLQKFKKLANSIINPNCVEEEEERRKAEKRQKQFMIATICLAIFVFLLIIALTVLYKRKKKSFKNQK